MYISLIKTNSISSYFGLWTDKCVLPLKCPRPPRLYRHQNQDATPSMFSACCFRLGSKLPPGVSQPPQFAKRPWETQPQSRGMAEPPAWSQHHSQSAEGRPLNHIPNIRNPKLRQYYLQGSSAACHRVTWGACGRDPLEMCLFILLESHAGPASTSAAAVEMSHVEREEKQRPNPLFLCFCFLMRRHSERPLSYFQGLLGIQTMLRQSTSTWAELQLTAAEASQWVTAFFFFVSSHNFTAILSVPRGSHTLRLGRRGKGGQKCTETDTQARFYMARCCP